MNKKLFIISIFISFNIFASQELPLTATNLERLQYELRGNSYPLTKKNLKALQKQLTGISEISSDKNEKYTPQTVVACTCGFTLLGRQVIFSATRKNQ